MTSCAQGSDHVTDILDGLFVSSCFILAVRNRDEDEGIPSENEEEKKLLDTRARELKGKMWEMVCLYLQLQMASLFMSIELSQSAQLEKQIVPKGECSRNSLVGLERWLSS